MSDTPWFPNYDSGMKTTLVPYKGTLLDCLAEAVQKKPDGMAVWFKGSTMTWRELDRYSDQFANALVDLGVKKGEPVSSVMVNSPQALIAQLGTWKMGGVFSPLNPIYTERELEELLSSTGSKVIVVLNPFYARIKALQSKTSLQHVIASNISDYLPRVKRILFKLLMEKKAGQGVTLQGKDRMFMDVIKPYAGKPRPNVVVSENDPALLLVTGGTTGIPKVAIGSHLGLRAAGTQVREWFQGALTDWESVFCVPLPLFHVFGNVGEVSTAMVGHYPLALVPDPRNIEDLAETIDKTKPAFFLGVPTMYIALLNNPMVKEGKVDFRSMKACISGAAPMLAETQTAFEKLTGGRIVEGYSLTEAMMACCVNPYGGKSKLSSVGMPLPDVTIRIADATTGEGNLPVNEVGEILMSAPQIMTGYWNKPEATSEMVQEHDGARWLHTGDIGYLDDEGYLFIVDRKKELIKASGYQVWPREVEEVLAQNPKVLEVAVAGVPDGYKGEAVAAWVVLKPGEKATVEELRAFAKDSMAPYKVPKYVQFRDTLPKTMVGKVLRRALVDEYKQQNPTA
jgi:long-chain acyl-CoA synthetase